MELVYILVGGRIKGSAIAIMLPPLAVHDHYVAAISISCTSYSSCPYRKILWSLSDVIKPEPLIKSKVTLAMGSSLTEHVKTSWGNIKKYFFCTLFLAPLAAGALLLSTTLQVAYEPSVSSVILQDCWSCIVCAEVGVLANSGTNHRAGRKPMGR